MNKYDAEKILTEYLKPIFGFTLKRCKNIQDAEDLSQEIMLRLFRVLLLKNDLADTNQFIWTVAHNALSNYYRDSAKSVVGVSIDEIEELIAAPYSVPDDDSGAVHCLQGEIAYLSKLQRRIVIAYYFENRKQADIAKELNIPLGTVKWHLFEAKKELKRGMKFMRKASELKFNPIHFHSYGINGSVGSKSPDEFFRSTLTQNICYCVRNTAKTVNEISEDLGVSPVYVETEVDFLEEYGLLQALKGKYIVNFIISEPTAGLLGMQDSMYKNAAALFANDLYDELIGSGILDDPDIVCHQTDGAVSLTETPTTDRNFILWSLIPYIAANSGERLRDDKISFEEVASIRPDGGQNIFHAEIMPENLELPEDYVEMKNWCGPMWNEAYGHILWQVDSRWSQREKPDTRYPQDAKRVLSLYSREKEGALSKDEYTWLAQRGFVKTNGDYDGDFKSSWQTVILASNEIKEKLLTVGEKIKEKHKAKLDALKAPYAETVLKSVPAHLRKVKEFELQYIFHSDGWFLLHCITELINNGKLIEPTEGQKKVLTTLILPK